MSGLIKRGRQRYHALVSAQPVQSGVRRTRATVDLSDRPTDYERNMNNITSVLESLIVAMSALLNLSVLRANQVQLDSPLNVTFTTTCAYLCIYIIRNF